MSQSLLAPLRERAAAELITHTSRQAVELEALERANDREAVVRLRVDYHLGMAELLALTATDCGDCPEGVENLQVCRQAHLDVLKHWHAELAQLEGQGA